MWSSNLTACQKYPFVSKVMNWLRNAKIKTLILPLSMAVKFEVDSTNCALKITVKIKETLLTVSSSITNVWFITEDNWLSSYILKNGLTSYQAVFTMYLLLLLNVWENLIDLVWQVKPRIFSCFKYYVIWYSKEEFTNLRFYFLFIRDISTRRGALAGSLNRLINRLNCLWQQE